MTLIVSPARDRDEDADRRLRRNVPRLLARYRTPSFTETSDVIDLPCRTRNHLSDSSFVTHTTDFFLWIAPTCRDGTHY